MRSKILDLLRSRRPDYVSGEEIARTLAISRTAVWKHIRELKQAGYLIEAQPRRGYCLQETPDLLLPAEIQAALKTRYMGRTIQYYQEIDSTNNPAKRLAAEGCPEGLLVVAETQGRGRGRRARGWFSPPGGGIWLSVVLRPRFSPQHAPKCTLMAAVAVVRAVAAVSGVRCGIKWPNDILYEGKKVTGILTEMSSEMDAVNYIVIGAGVNVNIEAAAFPEELRPVATSLRAAAGRPISRPALLAAILDELETLYDDARQNGFDRLLQMWRAHSVTLGREVTVIGDAEQFTGRAMDIDADGALLVKTAAGVSRVLAGDVSIRPAAR